MWGVMSFIEIGLILLNAQIEFFNLMKKTRRQQNV